MQLKLLAPILGLQMITRLFQLVPTLRITPTSHCAICSAVKNKQKGFWSLPDSLSHYIIVTLKCFIKHNGDYTQWRDQWSQAQLVVYQFDQQVAVLHKIMIYAGSKTASRTNTSQPAKVIREVLHTNKFIYNHTVFTCTFWCQVNWSL